MSKATQPTTSVDPSDSIIDDLLQQLGDDAVLETINIGDEVIEGVVSPNIAAAALAAVADHAGINDEVLDAIAANATAAGDNAANEQLLNEAAPTAPAPKKGRGGKKKEASAEPAAAPAAAPVAPKKGRAKKTSVPAGYGSDADEKKPEAAAGKTDEKPAEPPAPKEPRATKVTHAPGNLLMHKLGTAADELLVFDINHTPEQMATARKEFIERMNDRSDKGIADKVRDKICMLLVWLHRGAQGDLNEVLKRTFTVLHKEGKLTSGEKGNLQQNLLSKPYSIGTARSQANQMFMALPELKLVIKNKGEMIPNPDSILLAAINTKLGLA